MRPRDNVDGAEDHMSLGLVPGRNGISQRVSLWAWRSPPPTCVSPPKRHRPWAFSDVS